jgi:hypothetical protein
MTKANVKNYVKCFERAAEVVSKLAAMVGNNVTEIRFTVKDGRVTYAHYLPGKACSAVIRNGEGSFHSSGRVDFTPLVERLNKVEAK